MSQAAQDGVLEALRARVDALDDEVLGLLARRMELVGEIAAHKRRSRLPVRDLGRERGVLASRAARASALGLPPAMVEGLYRLILLGSRERQAALGVEVPVDLVARNVAVIGGLGGMGSLLARLFADLGHAVRVADLSTPLTPREAAASADVVVVSVPIAVTEEVIRAVGPHVRPDALLMDVTSLKRTPLAAMLEATPASVVGTHPLFGPGVSTLQGQRVVLCAGRGATWHAWVRQMLAARGLVVTETTAEHHDRMMAVVQVLNHFHKQVLGLALARMGVSMRETLRFTSPAYLLEAYVTARHFAQSPELYGPIEMQNPRVREVTDAFGHAAAELGRVVVSGDQAAFRAVFDEVRTFFGGFTGEALEQSRFLIDRVVELMAGRDPGAEG